MDQKLTKELEVQLEVQLLINLRKLIIEQQLFFTQIENLDDKIQKIICYLNIPAHINNNDILEFPLSKIEVSKEVPLSQTTEFEAVSSILQSICKNEPNLIFCKKRPIKLKKKISTKILIS